MSAREARDRSPQRSTSSAFVEDGVKWAHLDIAGMVWSDKPGAVHDKGATGYGVRVLDRFIADNFEK